MALFPLAVRADCLRLVKLWMKTGFIPDAITMSTVGC
jgi:hypothetical protein